MKFINQTLSLRDVLPSALMITLLGIVLCTMITPSWTWFGELGWLAVPGGIIVGVLMYAIAFALTCAPLLYTDSMRELMAILHSLFRRFSWFDIVLISILAGVGEELLIRGALQTWLIDWSNPLVGITLASIVFGCMHYLRPVYVVVTFILGAAFGFALYWSQSIALVIVAHTVYDILAFFIIVKRPHLIGIESMNENDKQLPVHEAD